MQIVEMLTQKGLEVYTRPDGRIFPVNQTAKDVVAILGAYLAEAGVEVKLETPVTGLIHEDGLVQGVHCGEAQLQVKAVVLATGGSSYPGSGTTGDGWPWARELSHTIVKIKAALAPIHVIADEEWPTRSGVSLRDCILKARQNGKEIARWRGDMLFTHHGISGPTALGISREVAERAGQGAITIEVDLLPDRTFEQVTEAVKKWALENPRKLWTSLIEEFVPTRLAIPFLESAQVSLEATGQGLDKKGKNRIVASLKGWPLGRVRDVPIEKGEVVAGGVSLDEVDSQTMASLKAMGLYLCGEVLDIAGPVGGYNLQAAFATGYVAGESAAKLASG